MNSYLYMILLVMFCIFIFWQQRRQSESAYRSIKQHCKQLNLQLLAMAWNGYGFRLPNGQFRFHTTYHFEFSSCGDDAYNAKMIMVGFRSWKFMLPPYRMVDEPSRVDSDIHGHASNRGDSNNVHRIH